MPERDSDVLAYRVSELERYRRETIEPWRARVDKQILGLTRTDEIAEAVAAKMRENTGIRLTRRQQALAWIVCLLTSASVVADVAKALHG